MMTDRNGPKQLATLVTAYFSVNNLLQGRWRREQGHQLYELTLTLIASLCGELTSKLIQFVTLHADMLLGTDTRQ